MDLENRKDTKPRLTQPRPESHYRNHPKDLPTLQPGGYPGSLILRGKGWTGRRSFTSSLSLHHWRVETRPILRVIPVPSDVLKGRRRVTPTTVLCRPLTRECQPHLTVRTSETPSYS